jgi:Family of unknown function (DUF695)
MTNISEKEDTWFTATGDEEGKPLIFRSRVKSSVQEANYPNLVTVYWDYETTNESGMPDEEINEFHISFEDTLQPLDSEALSHLMLVVTGNGRKEWYWYASDVIVWMERFNELLTRHPEYPIEIENTFEPDWSFYHNFISSVEDIEDINVS